MMKDEVWDHEMSMVDMKSQLAKSKEMVEYLYDCLDQQEEDFNAIVRYIDRYYAGEAASQKMIAKHYVRNRNGKGWFRQCFGVLRRTRSNLVPLFCTGKHAEWLPHVDKLIIEMLANRTPPSCIHANLYAMARVMFPDHIIVKELPSLKYIKDLRIPLYTVAMLLAAH
jgi:hypothetical protein